MWPTASWVPALISLKWWAVIWSCEPHNIFFLLHSFCQGVCHKWNHKVAYRYYVPIAHISQNYVLSTQMYMGANTLLNSNYFITLEILNTLVMTEERTQPRDWKLPDVSVKNLVFCVPSQTHRSQILCGCSSEFLTSITCDSFAHESLRTCNKIFSDLL